MLLGGRMKEQGPAVLGQLRLHRSKPSSREGGGFVQPGLQGSCGCWGWARPFSSHGMGLGAQCGGLEKAGFADGLLAVSFPDS